MENSLFSFSNIAMCVIAVLVSMLIHFFFQNHKNAVIRVSELYVYPIKSCRGVRVRSADVCNRGFVLDRLFAVVDIKNSHISLRCHPKMATIETRLSKDSRNITVSAPNMDEMQIPVDQPSDAIIEVIHVFEDQIEAFEVDCEISAWFTKALGAKKLKLMRMSDQFVRLTDKEFSPNGETGLADEFPFMLASEKSLDSLNKHLKVPVVMQNFRPNIVVCGCSAFEEDSWSSVIFTSSLYHSHSPSFVVAKQTSRCSLPNTHPFTGVRDNSLSVSKALREFRTGLHLGLPPALHDTVFFGVQLDHQRTDSFTVSVGDTLVVETGGRPS